MILITGGLGFIGLHTARALIDQGQTVVLTQYHTRRTPTFIEDDLGKTAFIEQLNVTDAAVLADIGEKYDIDGVVHLATPALGALEPADDFKTNMFGLLNILQAAEKWGVKRLSLASSRAVYGGTAEEIQRESTPLKLTSSTPTEAYKKASETIASHYADRSGLHLINLRIGGIWGPLYHSMANLPSRLVHAAVKGAKFELSGPRGPAYAEDGSDLLYVRDCGSAIAQLQVSENLNYNTYNIGAGCGIKNKEFLAAVQSVIPQFDIELPGGHSPGSTTDFISYMDLTRIREDISFKPQFSVEEAIGDYVAWLRAGNEE